MTKHFTRTKLAKEPPRVLGYRTVKVGLHRVTVAILPGGKAVGTSLSHPIGEKRNPGCGLGKSEKKKGKRS